MAKWTEASLADQTGKRVLITGGNSGIGFEAARMLAQRGAHVVLGCRDAGKGAKAVEQLKAETPKATASVATLDLASLSSIRACAKQLTEELPSLDVLINNAGVMALPYLKTADGFEMQLGTNHLGHFALTRALLPLLEKAPAPRVVSVSSNAHLFGRIRLDDLQSERSYSKWGAYGQSKLANLLFIYELERRLRAAGKKTQALACHPGYSATNLQLVAAKMERATFTETIMRFGNATLAQSAHMGALPTLYAACEPTAKGGEYIGPRGFLEQTGYPKVVRSNARSRDEQVARELWERSAALTGFPVEL